MSQNEPSPDAFDLVAALADLKTTVEGVTDNPVHVATVMEQVSVLLGVARSLGRQTAPRAAPETLGPSALPCWCEGKAGLALLKALVEVADAGKALDSYTLRSLVEKLDGRNRLLELMKKDR